MATTFQNLPHFIVFFGMLVFGCRIISLASRAESVSHINYNLQQLRGEPVGVDKSKKEKSAFFSQNPH